MKIKNRARDFRYCSHIPVAFFFIQIAHASDLIIRQTFMPHRNQTLSLSDEIHWNDLQIWHLICFFVVVFIVAVIIVSECLLFFRLICILYVYASLNIDYVIFSTNSKKMMWFVNWKENNMYEQKKRLLLELIWLGSRRKSH